MHNNDQVILNLSAKNQCGYFEDISAYVQYPDSLRINIDDDGEFCLSDKGLQSLKMLEIIVGRSTKLTFVTDHLYENVSITCLDKSVVYYIQIVSLVASNLQQSVNIHMQGQDAQSTVRIFPFLDNDARCTIKTAQRHTAFQSASDLYIQSFITKNAQFHHQAMIAVPQGIQKATITQKTAIFMAGDQCRASAVPSFDIASKDVHCEHGAAIGVFDELEKWYINARGLDEKQTAHVIIKARCLASLVGELYKQLKDEVVLMLDRCLSD